MNILDMSDEEFANLTDEQLDDITSFSEEEEYNEDDVQDEEHDDEESEEEYEESEEDEDTYEDEEEDESEDDADTEEDTEEELDEEDEELEDTDEEDTDTKDIKSDDTSINYEKEYNDILAPLKANKKEIKINSKEELRQLAQKGLNYVEKMSAIKPLRRAGKMLEDADLLDEEKLRFLIDLHNKEPKAIQKLIKDSGIDPLEIDIESTEEYEPKAATVDDKEVDLKDTLTELQQSTFGEQAIDIVGNKWDTNSRREISNNPVILKELAEHIEDGTYDIVNDIIEQARAKGEIPAEVTNLQAYKHVFMQHKASIAEKPKARTEKTIVTKKVNKSDTERTERRKAASVKKRKASSKEKQIPDNILDMDDADFEKLMKKNIF